MSTTLSANGFRSLAAVNDVDRDPLAFENSVRPPRFRTAVSPFRLTTNEERGIGS